MIPSSSPGLTRYLQSKSGPVVQFLGCLLKTVAERKGYNLGSLLSVDLNSDEFPRIGFEVAEKGRTGMIPQQDLAEMDTVDFTRGEYVGGVMSGTP